MSRTIYISTVFAYGDSGPELRGETFVPDKPGKSTYEITKQEAHRIANSYQSQGMPLTIICPNGVVGPGDHSHIGHFLRLYLNKIMTPIAPLLRALGLPAFMSPEVVVAANGNLNYSSAKAQRELGWTHKSAEEMWADVIDKELAYIAKNRDENLLFRLRSYSPSAL